MRIFLIINERRQTQTHTPSLQMTWTAQQADKKNRNCALFFLVGSSEGICPKYCFPILSVSHMSTGIIPIVDVGKERRTKIGPC